MPSNTQVPTLVIRPAARWVRLDLRELWQYRELLYFLTWRDIKVRYVQTALGGAWALIQPLTMMVIFVVLGRIAHISSEGIPRPVFIFTGLLPWLFFANSLQFSSNSLVGSGSLITKVYFPRLLVVAAPCLAAFVDFLVALFVLIGLMVFYGVYPDSWHIVLAAPCILLAFASALGIGMWLSALNVKYRDVRYALPFVTQIWLFVTPVIYPSALLSQPWRTVYGLNPMTGVVEGFRWALLGSGSPQPLMLALSAASAIVVLIGGAYYFRRTERVFADVV